MASCTLFAENKVWFVLSSVSHSKDSDHTFVKNCWRLPENPTERELSPAVKVVDGLLAPL